MQPASAAAFRDSVGVNVHSSYFDTAYKNWPAVLRALGRIGIVHVRDALPDLKAQSPDWRQEFLSRIDTATGRGLRFTFIMGRPGRSKRVLKRIVATAAKRLRPAVEMLEGPNEFDLTGSSRWPQQLAAYEKQLRLAVRRRASLAGVPVVAPSIVRGEERVGDLSPWLDLGNMHPYTGGLPPTVEHLQQELAKAARVAVARPAIATEAGFHNALKSTDGQPPVSEAVAAGYTLRTLLEHFSGGVSRTYLYELLDEKQDDGQHSEQHYGLLRHDFAEKPAATALRRLLALLGPAQAPAVLTPLAYAVRGDDVRQLLLQRADGAYLVVLWRGSASAWDTVGRQEINVSGNLTAVTLARPAAVTAYDPDNGDLGIPSLGPAIRWDGLIGRDPVVLLIRPQ